MRTVFWLVTVIDALTGTTRYGYDAAGNRLNVVDANTHTLTNTYDLLNRLVTTTDPLSHQTQFTYDAASNQVRTLDSNGKTITSTYDLLNRLTGIAYPAPDAAVAFAYDVIGRSTAMTDGTGTTTWGYDGVDRPISITQPYTGTVLYTYDSAGNRLSLTYPDGKVVNYRYDLATRLVSASDWLTQTTSYLYNAIGQPLTITLPNGVTSSFGYDSAERLKTITHQGITQTLASYTYTLDAMGNRTGVTETVLAPGSGMSTTAIAYNYNTLYQLKVAQYSTGAVFSYTYDAVGNRLTQTTITNSTAYTYDSANRLVNVAGQTYTWDANGNLLSDGVLSYTYDSANRPITITQGVNTYAFGYDAMGNRRRQLVNGVPTTYTLDLNANLVQVLADGNGNTYVYGNGSIAQQSATATAYFLPDALGSVRQLVDRSGAVTLFKRYDPYGNVMSSTGSAASIYGYTGEVTDGTGLVYLRARMYSPATGRFFVQDTWTGNPRSPGTLNLYSYGLNNPVRYTDANGHCLPWCVTIPVFAVAGGIFAASVYALSTPKIDTKDLLIAAGVGAIGGALIGTGVGAAQGGAVLAAAAFGGAGIGVLSSQLGYTVLANSTNSYDTSDMLVAAGAGGIIGGVTGVADVVAPGSFVGGASKVFINATGSMGQYEIAELLHERRPTQTGMQVNFLLGCLFGTWDALVPSQDIFAFQKLAPNVFKGIVRGGSLSALQQFITPTDQRPRQH